jgi:hypothetical protein
MFADLQTKNASSERKTAPEHDAHDGSHEINSIWQSLATLPIGLQAKLPVSQPDDPYELEADRVADRVMRMAAPPSIQRKCGPCEEEEQKLQRKENGTAPSSINHTLPSAGRPLDASSRSFFEPRFGRDFGHVRVHNDTEAAESARSVNALAYTVGQNIVFGAGQYAPGTQIGRSLLAHELSHVCQQTNGLVLRAPDPAALADFDTRAAALKTLDVFKKLPKDAKAEVEEILTESRKRDNALYLMQKLELLFNTPEAAAEDIAKAQSDETAQAAAAEKTRLTQEPHKSRTEMEEDVSKDPNRKFKTATVETPDGNRTFEIDARNPADIAIKARVRLVKAGAKTTKTDVENVASLEDRIEKRMAVLGYSVDLAFVQRSGDDVFTVNVDVTDWTTSGNWIGDDIGLAHELHHLLGLNEDRYDYIEAHAANEKMKVPDRIHWFLAELKKVVKNNELSIMHKGTSPPLDDDICTIAFPDDTAKKDDCIEKRTKARIAKIEPAQHVAFSKVFKAYDNLANMRPADPREFQEEGQPSMGDLKQRWALIKAELIFGKPISWGVLLEVVGALRHEVLLSNMFVVAEMTEGCDENYAVSRQMTPRILLCPWFFTAPVEEQTNEILREGVRQATGLTAKAGGRCPTTACDSVCGDENQPEAWVRYVECIADLGS